MIAQNKKPNSGSDEKQESKPSRGFFRKDTDEITDSKRIAKERLQNTKMRYIKNLLENNRPLSYSQKYELTFFLKKFFAPEDLSEYLAMKRNYTFIINGMSVLGLMNAVAVSVIWRRFRTLKTWQKVGISTGVFLGSHYGGTALVKKEAENMNDKLIDKYKYLLNEMSFNIEKQDDE